MMLIKKIQKKYFIRKSQITIFQEPDFQSIVFKNK